jgi:hypothetical protein
VCGVRGGFVQSIVCGIALFEAGWSELAAQH